MRPFRDSHPLHLVRFLLLANFGVTTAWAQTLIITNGVQTYTSLTATTVTLTGRCELHVTSGSNPIPGCLINLNSADALFVMDNVQPSTLVSTYLPQVRINGSVAVADSNCRVVEYGMGAVVIAQAPSFQPLQVFSGPHFTGTSLLLGQYNYYRSGLGALYAQISSFKLKRGYVATFAQNENGSGASRTYIAQDGDMEISVLPADLNDNVRFVYVLPWRWTAKKGIAGNIASGLNVRWNYNWDINQNSSRDLEYVAIRQTRYWPGLSQNWQSRGVNTLLGYNEPDNPTQDAYMPVGDALGSWPDLLATGLRVGSPVVTDGGRDSWLYPFMQQADAAGLRVDFVAVHYYQCHAPSDPNGAATQMYNFLKATYDQVKRPLWITEWNNGADWTGCGDPSFAQQQAAVAAITAMLDNTPFVERYAIYNWVEDVRRVEWDDGSLTDAGVTYRDKVSPIGYLQALPDNGTRSFTELRLDGNTLDNAGFGNNGITSGSPAYTNGVHGQAMVFDGANTVVTLPPNVARASAFTFAAWVRWNGGGNWQRIFDFGNSTTDYLFLTPSSGSGTLRFAIKNGGGEQIVETGSLPLNQWRHVAVTLSGNTARLYVNGGLVAVNPSMSVTPANFSPRVNFLGKSQFIADPMFNGLMDDVLITDYALSPSQIAALLTNTPPQFTNTIFAGGSATEGIAYSHSLAGTATDADSGDTLTYSKAIGPAWLNVAADGTLSGTPTSADGGTNYFTVRVTDAAGQNAFALFTVAVTTTTASGTWILDASGAWGNPSLWSGQTVATGAGQTADFSTLNILGNRVVLLDASRTIGNLKFGDTSGAQSWTLSAGVGAQLTLNSGSSVSPAIVVTNTATFSAPIDGTNGFTKSGPGTLILRGANPISGTINLDTGSTTLNEGAVRVAHPDGLANANLIQIRNNSGGSAASTLQMDGTAGDVLIDAPLSVTCRNNNTATIENIAGTNMLAGTIALNVGGTLFNLQSDSGLLVLNGTNQYVGSLTGGRTYAFSGAGSHLVNGPILNSTNGAPIMVTKSGSGTLTLAGRNTYAGTTTVSGGTLLVKGSIGAGGLTLSGGVTLGGEGSIGSSVTLPAGATLAPGAGIGMLTVSNSVELQAGSVTRMEVSLTPRTNDQLRVTGAFTPGGTLLVTNIGAMPLAAGDHFKLFNVGSWNGAFNVTELPTLDSGLAWNTSRLATLGELWVVNVNPPAIDSASVQDGQLVFSATGGTPGWDCVVLTSTNIALPFMDWMRLATNIFDASGSIIVTNSIDSAAPQVYFQLQVP